MDTTEAERLATMALEKQSELSSEAKRLGEEATGHETMAATINTSVSKLRSTLTTYDNELTTLKARAKTAASTKKINAQLSTMDSSGTVAMLERVEEEESLASAYGDILEQTDTTDKEIDKALADKTPKGSAMLDALKKRMEIDK